MAKYSVQKDDYVMIIAGKDKGKSGQVVAVDSTNGRVTIEGKGLTMRKKAVKARKASDKSGIIELAPVMDISNVMPICSACGQPTRVGHQEKDGKEVRICKKCGAELVTKKAAPEKKGLRSVLRKKKTDDEATAVEATEETKVGTKTAVRRKKTEE